MRVGIIQAFLLKDQIAPFKYTKNSRRSQIVSYQFIIVVAIISGERYLFPSFVNNARFTTCCINSSAGFD